MKNKTCLFLHWGPGGNSAIERLWFGETLPVLWWDQPTRFKEPQNAFAEVTQAALAQLHELARELGGPVHLIGHSFGAQLVLELSRLSPEKIKSITILTSTASVCDGFFTLGKRLGLTALAEKAATQQCAETFWPLVQAIVGTPDFMSLYWANSEARLKYEALAKDYTPVDMDAFGALMSHFIGRSSESAGPKLVPGTRVRYFAGKSDPLLDLEREVQAWQKIFPGCEVQRVDSGHFAHFETPPAVWMPS